MKIGQCLYCHNTIYPVYFLKKTVFHLLKMCFRIVHFTKTLIKPDLNNKRYIRTTN